MLEQFRIQVLSGFDLRLMSEAIHSIIMQRTRGQELFRVGEAEGMLLGQVLMGGSGGIAYANPPVMAQETCCSCSRLRMD